MDSIKAIFFDLDNTLIQTRKADKLTCNKLSEILHNEYNLQNDVATKLCSNFLKKFRQCPDNPDYSLDDWRLRLFHEAFGDKYSHLVGHAYQKWFQLRYHYLSITSDIKSMLINLRRYYFIVLISNGPSRAQWEKIKMLKLQTYFDLILISGDLPWEKPNKKIFHKACSYLNVESHQCIMIGDKIETDILGGIKAELKATIWLPLTTHNTDSLPDIVPDFTIDNITELLNILPLGVNQRIRKYSTIPDLEDGCSNASDGS